MYFNTNQVTLNGQSFKITNFKIDIAEFEKLPIPTPQNYNANEFSYRGVEVPGEGTSGLSILAASAHHSNTWVSIAQIRNDIENGDMPEKEIEYQFPDRVRDRNDSK